MPHQIEGVDFIKERVFSYIAFDMGLGKTFCGLAAISETEASYCLIVCPAYLKENWRNEAKVMGFADNEIQVVYGRKAKYEFKRITICGYDAPTLKNILLQSFGFDLSIFDEAHYLRGRGSQRSKTILGTDKRVKHTVCRYSRRVIFLSGSPLLNRPSELWPILQTVFPSIFPNFFQYAYRYCAAYQGNFGLDYSGASNLEELKAYLDSFVLRKEKSEVLDLPGRGIKKVILEKSKAAEKLLKAEADLGIDVEALVNEGVAIGEYATVRRELGLLKSEVAKDYISDIIDQGEDVVVFTYHKELARLIASNAITGETPVKDRQKNVDTFQSEGGSIVGTYGAMGTGFTLTKSCNVVLVELEYSPLLIEQAIDRLNRIGQTRLVTAHFLLWSEGLENDLFKTLKKKRKTFDTLFTENK